MTSKMKDSAIVTETPVFYFEEKDRYKNITPELLVQSVNVLDPFRNPPPTRPVEASTLIGNVEEILEKEKIAYTMHKLIVQKNGSRLLMTKDEMKNLPVDKTPIGKWQFERILMQWIFADESNLRPGITVAFHEKGIDMAFGLFNSFCYNHCIYGDHWYTTYNTKHSQKRMYDDMINGIIAWLHNFEQNISVDREIITKMMNTKFEAKNLDAMISFIIGNIYRKAYRQAYGDKAAAPFTINNMSRFVGDLEQLKIQEENFSLWDIYNVGTNLAKPDHVNIEEINQSNFLWGDFVIKELSSKISTLN